VPLQALQGSVREPNHHWLASFNRRSIICRSALRSPLRVRCSSIGRTSASVLWVAWQTMLWVRPPLCRCLIPPLARLGRRSGCRILATTAIVAWNCMVSFLKSF